MSNKKTLTTIIVMSILVCSITADVHAQGAYFGDSYVQDGLYISGYLGRSTVGGDFDDEDYLFTSDLDFFNMPDLDSGTGFGVGLGYKRDRIAFELSYLRTKHNVDTVGLGYIDFYYVDSWYYVPDYLIPPEYAEKKDAILNSINLDLKIDVLPKDQIRPFVQIGVGFPWLTIDNNKYTIDYFEYDIDDIVTYGEGTASDETFYGVSFNLGGGLSYYFTPQWSLNASYIYRWTSFSKVDSVEIDDNVSGTGSNMLIGIAYTF